MSQSVPMFIYPQLPNTVQGADQAQFSLGRLINSPWIKESDKLRPFVDQFINIFAKLKGDDDDDVPIIEEISVQLREHVSEFPYDFDFGFNNFQPLITGATSVLTYARARQTGVSKGVFGAALAYYGYSAYNIYNTQTDEPSSSALTLTTCPNPLYEPDDVFKAAPPEPKPKLVTELKLIKPGPSKIEPNKIDGFPLLLGTLIILLAANAK